MTLKQTDARVRSGASFRRQVESFLNVAKGRANQVVRKAALGVLSNVVLASPVDTGRFRGNWQVGVGARPTGEVEGADRDGTSTIAAAASALEGAQVGDTVYVSNNLPYARRLEYGHSQQAPRGVVRVTLANLRDILEEAVKASRGGGGP